MRSDKVPTLTHPDDLIRRLRLDRRRCFVIIGRPGEGKTRLARAMAARYDGQYLDLLTQFAADPTLPAALDTLTPQWFKEYLQPYATRGLVLVDEMEFLWHCWDVPGQQQFLSIISRWSKPAFFGVFLPPDPVLEAFSMTDQDSLPRRFLLAELQGLE
jgi:hypothetical protein